MKRVCVTWVDSESLTGWFGIDEAIDEIKTLECTTIGQIMKKTKEWTMVGATHSPELNHFNQIIVIPNVSIISVEEI